MRKQKNEDRENTGRVTKLGRLGRGRKRGENEGGGTTYNNGIESLAEKEREAVNYLYHTLGLGTRPDWTENSYGKNQLKISSGVRGDLSCRTATDIKKGSSRASEKLLPIIPGRRPVQKEEKIFFIGYTESRRA